MKYCWVLVIFLIVSACSKGGDKTPPVGSKVESRAPVQAVSPEANSVSPIEFDKALSPLEAIKDLDRKIESYKTGSALTEAEVKENLKLKQGILRGAFDISELSRLALDTHWNEISASEQKNFTELMISLLERKAIFSKEQVKGEGKPYQVSYKEQKFLDAAKQKAKVTTLLVVPSEKVDLNINYELKSTPQGWRIYDVIVDDASLVDNYKFQFNTIITKYGFQNLIDRMQKKLKEME